VIFGSRRISLVERSHLGFCFCGFCFVCVQVRIFLLLPAIPMMAVSGRSRPMRAGFPTRTRSCRSFEEAHSLLGRRVCAYRERQCFRKTLIYLLKHFLASFFINSNTWHLICNNNFITWISWYCVLVCVFVHSHFIENPPVGSWETNPCFFRGVLSHKCSLVMWLMAWLLIHAKPRDTDVLNANRVMHPSQTASD
jgi:hypothetical protein